MPSLKKLNAEFIGQNFKLLAIDMNEKKSTVAAYADRNGLDFTILLDTDGNASSLYGVSSTPMKIVIDKDGYMTGAALGYRSWDKPEVRELIHKLMAAPSNN